MLVTVRVDKKDVIKYQNNTAHYWTATDAGMEVFIQERAEAARDVQYWNGLKKACGKEDRDVARYCSNQEKQARKFERAANLWIDKFTKIGRHEVSNYPVELNQELDYIMYKASEA